MLDRLYRNWVYGGFLAGLLLLALTPLFATQWPAAQVLTFLLLPAYMLHQFEEHEDGRFGRYVNDRIGGGLEVLDPRSIFVINIGGVWGVFAASFWMAALAGAGFGLIAVYVTLVNAVVHILPAVFFRQYNPGLVTAILVLLPLSALALLRLSALPDILLLHHVIGLGFAVCLHAAIVAYAFSRKTILSRTAAAAQAFPVNSDAIH